LKNKTFRILVFASLAILLFSTLACGGDKETEKISQDATSPAEVADIIIEKKKTDAQNLQDKTMTPAAVPATQTPTKTPEIEKLFYIEGSVNPKHANFLKEVELFDLYGEKWNVWMQSSISFRKNAYKNQEISDRIALLVFLKPSSERDDSNYVTLDFDIHPPGTNETRWSASMQYFDSRTQGQAQFSFAYNIFIQDWKEADIINLAQQVLNIALKETAN
jgi:hypothetical protein